MNEVKSMTTNEQDEKGKRRSGKKVEKDKLEEYYGHKENKNGVYKKKGIKTTR